MYYCSVVSSVFFFFFSSRRRHTRFDCDWSSDVCSSDLLDQCSDVRADLGRRRDPRAVVWPDARLLDRKSTRLNSSHSQISYAVFCLKKKKKQKKVQTVTTERPKTESIRDHTRIPAPTLQ